MSGEREITVISRNYDLSIRRKWKGRLIRERGPLIELVGEFDRDVAHPELGIVGRGTLSHEYYWRDRWYNVFRFNKPCGERRSYYCNINMPPKFEGGVVDYVDLDIDVVVRPDGGYCVLDREEFTESAIKFGYTQEFKVKVELALENLLGVIERRDFPFKFVDYRG